MTRAILYVHGMGGSAQEAEHYRRICPGFEVIGVDYEGYVPETVRDTIRRYYDDARGKYESVSVIANSIGAYFSMLALGGREVAKAMFVSPVLDMERVILDMMEQAGVSEQELREKGEIPTASGQVLAWKHWFHTEEQVAFLDEWIRRSIS